MNVSQYSPSRQLERQSIGSIDALPSVKEALQESSRSARGEDAAAKVVCAGTWETEDAVYEYEVDNLGRCAIKHCTIKDRTIKHCAAEETHLSIPDAIDGYPVAIIAGHSFSTCYELSAVDLPSTVTDIREHAFMNTALICFSAPPALRRIGSKAFYRCEHLQEARLNNGLLSIGEGAFRESALQALDIPASVSFIGRDAFKGTALVFSGADQTLLIAKENEYYGLLDGVLYCVEADGLVLVQMLDDNLAEYRGITGLVHVGDRAFSGKRLLREAVLPEGVLTIGEAAFKGCSSLTRVMLPDTLKRIGRQAFRQTALERLRIPRDLIEVGAEAFYTGGSVARDFQQSIRVVEVAPGNEVFYVEEDTLCQRTDEGAMEDATEGTMEGAVGGTMEGAIALLHFGTSPHIVVPRSVTAIGPYAFLNSRHATQVTMHDRIGNIDVGGLDFGRALSKVVFETSGSNPERYVIEYPPGDASSQMARITFGGSSFDVEFAYAEADRAILHAQDLFTRARMMLDRLMNPVHLSVRADTLFRSRLRTAVPLICVEFGRNGYMEGVDYLLDLGFIDRENIQESIDTAIEAGEVAVVSRLVEIKRTRFDMPLFDWGL